MSPVLGPILTPSRPRIPPVPWEFQTCRTGLSVKIWVSFHCAALKNLRKESFRDPFMGGFMNQFNHFPRTSSHLSPMTMLRFPQNQGRFFLLFAGLLFRCSVIVRGPADRLVPHCFWVSVILKPCLFRPLKQIVFSSSTGPL